MRIAIVGTELCAVDARGGGLEQVLRRWAAWLAAQHEVVVVSHRRGGLVSTPDLYDTVEVARTADLDATLARLRPDVVSLHNRPAWVRRCPASAAAAVTFHNYPSAWKFRGDALPPAARYSAVSVALADLVAARLPADVAAVVTPPSIAPEYGEEEARRPGRNVLFPHRLMRKKGVLELLAAAKTVELRDVPFEFADLLSPWLRPTAEHRELRAAVTALPNASLFRPATEPSTLARLYATAGAVACPAVEPEGLGLVCLEAQACGAPVVTTDLGGLREATFAPNRCIAPHDTDALVAALVDALRREQGGGARAAVLDRYSPAASGEAYERWLTAGV